MNSIRGHITAALLVGLFVLLAGCGALLYLYVRHALLSQFDESLLAKARTFAAMSEQEEEDDDDEHERAVSLRELPRDVQDTIERRAAGAPVTDIEQEDRDGTLVYRIEVIQDGVELEFSVSPTGEYLGSDGEFDFEVSEAALPEFQQSPNAEYYQVWEEDGEAIAKSPSLEDADLTQPRLWGNGPKHFDTILPDGREGRAVALCFAPRLERPVDTKGTGHNGDGPAELLVLVMARSRNEVNRALGIILTGLLFTGALLLISAALLVRWAVHRGLSPLGAVARQAATIDAGNLAYRFPTSPMPREMLPICHRLNELLERLEAAFLREKRFRSDVAHELRTPIAELRSLAEVGLRSSPSMGKSEELPQYLRDALAIAVQMERLVTALLTLARCESGQQAADLGRVEIVTLVKEAWRPFREKAGGRALAIDFQVPEEAFLETDGALLTAVLTNLFSNAVAYTPRSGKIQVGIKDTQNALELSISNTNDQLTREDLTHQFEPFWRKDKARSGSSHSGVGLAIVAAFANLLGTTLAADLPSHDLFNVTLGLKKDDGRCPP